MVLMMKAATNYCLKYKKPFQCWWVEKWFVYANLQKINKKWKIKLFSQTSNLKRTNKLIEMILFTCYCYCYCYCFRLAVVIHCRIAFAYNANKMSMYFIWKSSDSVRSKRNGVVKCTKQIHHIHIWICNSTLM